MYIRYIVNFYDDSANVVCILFSNAFQMYMTVVTQLEFFHIFSCIYAQNIVQLFEYIAEDIM